MMPVLTFDWFILLILWPAMVCGTWYAVTELKCQYWMRQDEEENQ
jgi:hypothetical protein